MKKNTMRVLGLSLAVIMISGCAAEVEPIEEEARKIPVELMSMKRDVVEHTYVTVGEVVPNNQVDIYVSGGGYIETINTVTGALVEKDMLLIELDDSDANMANYNAMESQLRTVRDNLGSQLASLEDTYESQKVLFQEGAISKSEFDRISDQIDSIKREYANAEVAYSNQLTILRNDLKDDVDSRIITSPVSGMVAAVYAKEGQPVNNQLALIIIDDSRLLVRTFVSGELKKVLCIGDCVSVKINGQTEESQSGQIFEIKKIPDPATKLFEVQIEIPQQDEYIIGDYAEVEFIIESYEAILVPTQAVVRKGSFQYVYIHEEDELRQIQIEPGRTSGRWLEVKNVDELEMVVVKGQNQITSMKDFIVIE
jgi:RND family efflux transporter MFP subunit